MQVSLWSGYDHGESWDFRHLPDDPNLRLVAVSREHVKWIEKALERAPNVRAYQPHEIDM
jgi:hypothetical protein